VNHRASPYRLKNYAQCTTDDCPTYKFIEKLFTYRFVMGLRAEFDAIHTRLLHGSTTLTMSAARDSSSVFDRF
jgi:hypothetical protein